MRAVCLLVVVALHSMMVGVDVGLDGNLLTGVAIAGTTGFVPVSWIIQVMPLFFIAGGFAALSQWRRMRSRGSHWTEYVRGRTRRLVVPTAVMFSVVGVVLCAAEGLGADPVLIAEARLRIGQPLWFLAAYLGVTALVPAMARLHERRPAVTLAVLGMGVLAVDAVRLTSGVFFVGFLNLGPVWLLMQQLGFFYHDGAGQAWPRRRLAVAMTAALSVLLLLVTLGPYSADMLVSLNPPTAAIVLLGTAQFFALRLVKPALDWMTGGVSGANSAQVAQQVRGTRSAWRLGTVVSAHAMTVYLWHMPVVLTLVMILWVCGFPLPEPHSPSWWATRLPWLLAVGVATRVTVVVIGAVARGVADAVRWMTAVSQRLVSRGSVRSCAPGSFRALRASSAVVWGIAGVTLMLLQVLPLVPTTLLSLMFLGGSFLMGRQDAAAQGA
ncbi:acyltransferase family protein [Brevibacterium yomogidense]|uniref:acyltransferase family protein n=1 Tax=Brevibacterium yomogidense TaxID=946573 RepID=UPI0018DF7579